MSAGIFLALISLLLYGLWGFSYKMLSTHSISTEWGVSLAMIAGGMASAALAIAKGHSLPALTMPQAGWILAIAGAGALGNILLVRSMASPGMHAGSALAISGAYPLVAALLAWVFLAEATGARQAVGMLLIIAGVAVLTL